MRWLPACLALSLVTACAAETPQAIERPPGPRPPATWAATTSTSPPTGVPAEPESLSIGLDPSGWPYDVSTTWGWEDRELDVVDGGQMMIPGGEVMVIDGIAVEVDVQEFATEGTLVELAGEVATITIITETAVDNPSDLRVLAVRLDIPGTTVAEWGPFEHGYGTDGGLGAIVAWSVVESPQMKEGPYGEYLTGFTGERNWQIEDLDTSPGLDSILFRNGYGDGGFPLVRGLDEAGRNVSLMVWQPRHPWRLMIDDGAPPPDVERRERELDECLRGVRGIDSYGECTHDVA